MWLFVPSHCSPAPADLILGLELALGGSTQPLCYVESDVQAAELLAARIEDGALPAAPVWSDVRTFPGVDIRSRVDLVASGFPCQDLSYAGRGDGLEGSRSGLWWAMRDVVRDVQPWLVFVENVPGLVTRGIHDVLGSLAQIGFDAEWLSVRASEVGAPHRRERVFILAERRDLRPQRVSDAFRDAVWNEPERGRGPARATNGRDAEPRHVGAESVANTSGRGEGNAGGRRPDGRLPEQSGDSVAEWDGGSVANAIIEQFDSFGWALDFASRHPVARAAAESTFRRVADGMAPSLASRVDALRLTGNGVVPLQAALAFAVLAQRLGLR